MNKTHDDHHHKPDDKSDKPVRVEIIADNAHDGLGNKYFSGDIVTQTAVNAEAIKIWLKLKQAKPA